MKAQANVSIKAPNLVTAEFQIRGTAPYVQLRFSEKVRIEILEKMKQGSTAKSKKTREARDYDAEFHAAMYVTEDGKHGIPANAFRDALISACRLVGFKMTIGKLSLFTIADGYDKYEPQPLVFIDGEPEMFISHVRNATGVMDLRTRALFRNWSANVKIRFDADQFTVTDIANLLARVGLQVGLGEGRPDSRNSAGMGWGLFEIFNGGEE